MKTLSRIIGALLLVLLAGCSAVQTGYNHAPSLAYWWLDGYIDFNADQAEPVRASLDSMQAWHRKTELPAYVDLLRRLQQLAPGEVNADQVCAATTEVRTFLQQLGGQAAEGMARFAPTVQPDQLRHLTRQFEKHNLRWREEWLDGTPQELLQRRLKRTLDRYEDFYGRLDENQRTLLRTRLTTSGFDPQLAWAERQRRQQDLLRVLQEHRAGDRLAHIKAEMLALVERSLTPPDPVMRAGFERMLRDSCRTLADLHNSTSPAQRQRLEQKLRSYETAFQALAGTRG